LFLVAQERGWARSGNAAQIPIEAYQAVFWDRDEWHETGTEPGMTAVVLEGEHLDQNGFMLEWKGM